MIEKRSQRILFFQALFLVLLCLLPVFFLKNSVLGYKYFIFCAFAIALNLFYIKKFALPSVSLLRKIRTSAIKEDTPWAEIEETIARKDVAFIKQKEEFELENLKYKRLLDSLQDPVFIFTSDLTIIYANEAFTSLFKFIDKKLPVHLIEVSRNLDFQDYLQNAVKTDQTSTKRYFSFNQLQDPHKTYFDLKVFPVDKLNNFLCLLHDVTDRKMADQVREDFVSNFSHEVRTPLTILNGQMQILKNQLIKNENFDNLYGSSFVKIENNSRRLINLFNDLLRLTSVESIKEISKEKIDIEEMLTFITMDLAASYPDKKIQFDIDLSQKVFYVDYHLFEQVLLNLIDNAIKYINHSGIITIRSFHDDSGDHLTIKDNGVGIPEDQLPRIFERFFRVDASRSSEIQGTGLGLSIVKHIVQKHDGKIKAQSRPNEGTTFTLSFPSV